MVCINKEYVFLLDHTSLGDFTESDEDESNVESESDQDRIPKPVASKRGFTSVGSRSSNSGSSTTLGSSQIQQPEVVVSTDSNGSSSTVTSNKSSTELEGSESNESNFNSVTSSSKAVKELVSNLTGIKAPPVIKRRGRPRGHELTTIGLPAKKAKKETLKKPRSFSKMHTSEKEEGRSNISGSYCFKFMCLLICIMHAMHVYCCVRIFKVTVYFIVSCSHSFMVCRKICCNESHQK